MKCGSLLSPYKEAWNAIATGPRELKLLLLVIIISAFGTTAISTILVIYLSDEFGYTDVEATTLLAISAVSCFVLSLLIGRFIDKIGVRASFVISGVLGVVGSLSLALAWSPRMIEFVVAFLLPLSIAFSAPVITIATKRFTYRKTLRIMCANTYNIANVGASFGYVFSDFIRARFRTRHSVAVYGDYSATAARIIILFSAITTLFAAMVACGFRNIMIDSKGAVREFSASSETTTSEAERLERAKHRWYKTFCESNFIRLALFSIAMFPLMKMFSHFDVTFPKFAVRELGDNTLFGTIKAVNPIIIAVFQLPFSHVFGRRFGIYTVVQIGTAVSALATFLFCLPPSYAVWVASFVCFTIGEMIFSHRTSEVATLLMPKGREGIYLSLVGIYLVAPRFIVDSLSGWLLSTYCSATGERHCQLMWLIIALMNCVTILLLALFRRYIVAGLNENPDTSQGGEEDDDNEIELQDKQFIVIEAEQRKRPSDNDDD